MSNISQVITIRLRKDELAALDKVRVSELKGEMTRTEYIRFLILAAAAKNAGRPVPKPKDYQREFRTGPWCRRALFGQD